MIPPSSSWEPAEEKPTDSGALPVFGVVAAAAATGATFGTGSMVTVKVAEPVAPSLSVTVRVTTWAPMPVNVNDGLTTVAVLPPPKFHT